jgi:hypothetical protein
MPSDETMTLDSANLPGAKTRKLLKPKASGVQSPPNERRLLIALTSAVVLLLAVVILLLAGVLSKNRGLAPVAAQADSPGDKNLATENEDDFQLRDDASFSRAAENGPPDDGRPAKKRRFASRAEQHGPEKGRPRPHPHPGPPHFGGPRPIDPKRLESLSVDEQFRLADRNDDKFLDPAELPLHLIHRVDANDDDELTFDEWKRGVERLGRDLYGPPSDEELRDLPDHHGPPRGPAPHRPPRHPR